MTLLAFLIVVLIVAMILWGWRSLSQWLMARQDLVFALLAALAVALITGAKMHEPVPLWFPLYRFTWRHYEFSN